MAKFKATWIAFDGSVHNSEIEATAYESELKNLGLKDYLKSIGINLTAKDVDLMIKERKHLIKLLKKHEIGNKKKGKKSSKSKN